MIDLLNSLVGFISAIFNFLWNTIQALVSLITRIPSYITFISSSLVILPTVIIPFVLASVSIYVVYLITGRK